MTNSDYSSKFNNCPCGGNLGYEKCCQPLHNRQIFAQSAEQLMRSRYCAFVMEQWTYLAETSHPKNTSTSAVDEIKEWSRSKNWQSLKIINTRAGKPQDDIGEVEFVAFYKESVAQKSIAKEPVAKESITNKSVANRHPSTQSPPALHQHHEHSQFKRLDSQWMFTEGTALEPIKISRNDPCPCLSGKKAKKCCFA